MIQLQICSKISWHISLQNQGQERTEETCWVPGKEKEVQEQE
jgi:hypothetical protein